MVCLGIVPAWVHTCGGQGQMLGAFIILHLSFLRFFLKKKPHFFQVFAIMCVAGALRSPTTTTANSRELRCGC